MSENGPTSPDDPAWVDDIVRRALERTETAVPQAPADVARPDPAPAAPIAPVAEAPRPVPSPAPSAPAAVPGDSNGPFPAAQAPGTVAAADDTGMQHLAATSTTAPAGTNPPADTDAIGNPAAAHTASTAPTSTLPRPDAQLGGARGPYPDAGVPEHFDATAELEDHTNSAMSNRMRGFLEWGAVVVGALAVALLIKTFLMQAYFIPSSSMESTLNIGDRVLVNKLSYEFGDIGRGDLIVFNRPPSQQDGEDDLIKRVIGLPGETVEIIDGQVRIIPVGSDQVSLLDEPYLAEGVSTTGFVDTSGCVTATPTSCVIPDGHVFVLGDNRPGSKDGRYFGPIDQDLVVGRAFLRVWPLSAVSFL